MTTGAIDQFGSSSSICRVSRSTRAFAVLDGVNVVLQHDLLRRMGKPYRGQPAPAPAFAQPRRQLDENLGAVLENPDLADLAAPTALRNRHSDRRLVHIQSYVSDSIHQARLPCMRLCAGQSGITLDILHVERRAADHSANIGSKVRPSVQAQRQPSRFRKLCRRCPPSECSR